MTADQQAVLAPLLAAVEARRFEPFLLHGITGSGKSATMAWTIEAVQRPTLVIAPNKTLGGREELCGRRLV